MEVSHLLRTHPPLFWETISGSMHLFPDRYDSDGRRYVDQQDERARRAELHATALSLIAVTHRCRSSEPSRLQSHLASGAQPVPSVPRFFKMRAVAQSAAATASNASNVRCSGVTAC